MKKHIFTSIFSTILLLASSSIFADDNTVYQMTVQNNQLETGTFILLRNNAVSISPQPKSTLKAYQSDQFDIKRSNPNSSLDILNIGYDFRYGRCYDNITIFATKPPVYGVPIVQQQIDAYGRISCEGKLVGNNIILTIHKLES